MLKHFAFFASLVAAPAAAQVASERLVQPALPGFVIGHQASQGPISIEERVPQGESVQRWTQMVTTQHFAGIVSVIGPEQLLQRMAQGLAQSCPGAVASDVRSFEVAGRPAAELRGDCPHLAATGLPETFFARGIGGMSDLHVVQVAFRRVPTAQDEAFARRHLEGTLLCGSGLQSGCD